MEKLVVKQSTCWTWSQLFKTPYYCPCARQDIPFRGADNLNCVAAPNLCKGLELPWLGKNDFLEGFSHFCSEHLPQTGKEQHQSTLTATLGHCNARRNMSLISGVVTWVWTLQGRRSFIFHLFSVEINFLLLYSHATWNMQWYTTSGIKSMYISITGLLS